jgi:DNA primase
MDKKEKAKTVKIETLYPFEKGLRLYGNKLRGMCPFHKDATNPNFFIYIQTNSWYCFAGCGGGDVISFLMKLDNLDFKEAVKELNKRR